MSPPVTSSRKPWLIAALCVGVAPYYLNGFYNPKFVDNHAAFWVVDVLTYAVMPFAILLALTLSKSVRLDELGYHARFRGRRNPAAVIVACIVITIFMFWVDGFFFRFSYETFPVQPGQVLFEYEQFLPPRGPATGAARFAAVFYFGLGGGLVEEFYYRGLLREIFGRDVVRSALFVVASTALFAGAHFEGGPAKILYAGCWGLALALLYLLTDNLWPLMIVHAMTDWLFFDQC